MTYDFKKIINEFNIEGSIFSCEKYGEGHINETFLAVIDNNGLQTKYIIQRINKSLFKDIDKLMNNIVLVTDFNRGKIIERGGDADRESLTVVHTVDGKPFYYCESCGEYFRIYKFITDAVAYQKPIHAGQFYSSAVAFGNFAKLLAEFDASQLYEILPDFHNTEKRYNDFIAALEQDVFNRSGDIKKEIEFIKARKQYCSHFINLLNSGELPLKVTHNDTKLNNVMLDVFTDAPVAVIDLDTIMPGTICFDFGDSIRFGCNTGAEDEVDLNKVSFDIQLFEEYTRGYLTALGESVAQIEKDNLSMGALIMTLECGIRFLTDYLNGDTYFRTSRPGQNLDRARTQFKLVAEMENHMQEMNEIVNKY